MNEIFFVDVDPQRHFALPSWALYAPEAERTIPKLVRLFDFARKNGIFVLSSVDSHSATDAEFSEFPPHCIKGTEGHKKLPETLMAKPLVLENREQDRNFLEMVRRHQQVIVEKQTLDLFSNPSAARLLAALPKHAVVFGFTTEYCVRLAVLGLIQRGTKSVVVTDAICAASPPQGDRAMEEMRRAGARFAITEDLVKAYAG